MSKEKEIIELCTEVFKSIGAKRLASRLEDYIEFPDSSNLDKVYEEALRWQGFENEIKRKNFIFGNNYSLLKFFIISTEKDYDRNGRPVIIINKLEDETASFKDNPIKNCYIIYENEEDRDIDYERLLIAR